MTNTMESNRARLLRAKNSEPSSHDDLHWESTNQRLRSICSDLGEHGTIMADATTVVEGKVKYREGRKVSIILQSGPMCL